MIGFLQPFALLGLAAAAIPPLLHLLSRRVPKSVVFPAVRYLAVTEREQSRRLKLRNLLLMVLRMAVISFLVLAAARPVARVAISHGHPPAALALVVDNSLSSAAIVGGRPMLELATEQARRVVARVQPDDRLWLVLADGVPRLVGPAGARQALDSLSSWPLRLDLAAAARAAAQVVAAQPLALHEVVVLSDLQATAWTAGPPADADVLVWQPPAPPANRALDSAFALPPEWRPDGQVVAFVAGDDTEPLGLRLTMNGRDVAHGVARPGEQVGLAARAPGPGWFIARVDLDPDELRLDDRWWLAVASAPPAAVTAESGAGVFVGQAIQVLTEGGRVRNGSEVVLADHVTGAMTVVFPPADPALVGALNRALAARGSTWRLGPRVSGEWTVSGDLEAALGATVRLRHRLEGNGTVWARVGGEPWIVTDGTVVLVASRMEEAWSELPVRAGFVPFVDLLVNRIAAREGWVVRATPGASLGLPPGVDGLVAAAGRLGTATDGRIIAPFEPGVYFLTAGSDTVGALEVNHDRRESRLAQANPRTVRSTLGDRAHVLETATLDRELFGGARRASLAGPLLAAALLAALAELTLATLGRTSQEH